MKKRKPDQPKGSSFDRAEMLLWGLALVVPIALWHTFAPTTIKGLVIGFLVGAAFLVVCARIAKGSLHLPLTEPLVALVTGGFAWKVVSALYGQRFYASSRLLVLAAVYCLVFICVVALIRGREQAFRLMLAAAYGAIPVAIVGVFEHYGLRIPILVDNGLGRVYSTMGNPTFLAAYFALILPVQLCLFVTAERKAHRIGMAVAACLTSLCFVWTYSRGSWAGLALALVALVAAAYVGPARAMIRSRGKSLAVLAIALAAVVAFAVVSGPGTTSARRSVEGSRIGFRSSDTIRKALMTAGLRMFRDHTVLGVGLGGYSVRFSEYVLRKPVPGGYELGEESPHNEVVQIAAEEGIPGVAIYLSVLGALIAYGIRGLKRAKGAGDAHIYLLISGLAAGLLAFGGDLMANVAIRVVYVGVFWWIWAGLLYVLANSTAKQQSNSMPIWRKVAAFAAGLAVLVVLVYANIAPLVADAHTLSGVQAMKRGDPDGWIRGNKDALRAYPNATTPLYYLGVAYIEAGYPREALAALRRYNARYPHGNSVDYETNRAYLRLGDFRSAVRFGEMAARKDPSNPKVWQSLAAAYCAAGDRAKTKVAARKAARLTSDRNLAAEYKVPRHRRSPGLGQFLTAEELIRAELYQQAISELQEALKSEPRNAHFLTVLGATYWRIGDSTKAELVLRAAVGIDPGLVDAHGYLGALYLQSGRKAQAREESMKAISLQPDERRLATFRQMLAQCE